LKRRRRTANGSHRKRSLANKWNQSALGKGEGEQQMGVIEKRSLSPTNGTNLHVEKEKGNRCTKT
jgi:hypothetical protein